MMAFSYPTPKYVMLMAFSYSTSKYVMMAFSNPTSK